MKKGQARPVVKRVEALAERRKVSIWRKCHPAFFELAPLWKQSVEGMRALGPNPPADRVREIQLELERRLEEIERKYSGPIPPPPNTFAAQTIFRFEQNVSDDESMSDFVHFARHKVPLRTDLKGREEKNWSSANRVLRTAADLEQLRCGRRIRPFKGNPEHWDMFQNFWGFGLEKLTPEEMADVFDLYCPCDCGGHDPDALKKHLGRFKKAIGMKPSQ